MNFEEALIALKEDKNVKRKKWHAIDYLSCDLCDGMEIYVNDEFIPYPLTHEDLFATDWEIVE